jgi:hypothetical protein
MNYPFNHECQWRGPFYIWSSNQVDEAPPKECQPVYTCCICGAQSPGGTVDVSFKEIAGSSARKRSLPKAGVATITASAMKGIGEIIAPTMTGCGNELPHSGSGPQRHSVLI